MAAKTDSNPKPTTEQGASPSWMHMPISRAVSILEDMTSGQLYNFGLSNFAYMPEPALTLMLAAETAIKADDAGIITLSQDATWAIGMILDARLELEFERPEIPGYIRAALNAARVSDLFDGDYLTVPIDYMPEQEIHQPKPVRKTRPGYVYVLRSPTGAFKIGMARNPENRIETFSVKLPFEVEYEILIKTDDMRGLESQLHRRYAEKHINGEWFALTENDLVELRAMGGAS